MSDLKYYTDYYKCQAKVSANKEKKAARENAESAKEIINSSAEASIKTITDDYNTQILDTKESYESDFKSNEVQVKLNERYLQRKAAEMGLTDSGMNRTQMTANQLSYANQKGELTKQRQKAVDTLAATMRGKITDVNTARNSQLAEVESNLKTTLAQIDSDHNAWVNERAADAVKAEQEAATKAAEAKQTEFSSLWKTLKDENDNRMSDKTYLARLMEEYNLKYDVDFDSIEWAMLLNAAGMEHEEYLAWVRDYYGVDADDENEISNPSETDYDNTSNQTSGNTGKTAKANNNNNSKKGFWQASKIDYNFPDNYIGAGPR